MEQTQYSTDGLIIREQNIGENDKLVTILTRDMGVISAYAAGSKSIKSKKASSTCLLSYSSFVFKKKGDFFRIAEASPIKVFFNTGEDIEALYLAQYFCELAAAHTPDDKTCNSVLRLFLNALHFLSEKKRNIFLLKAIVELRLLSIIGYMPDLIACKKCIKYENDLMYFDTLEGLIFCTECEPYRKEFAVLNKTLLTAMRHIIYSDFEKLFFFTLPDDACKALSSVTETYLINKTEQKLKTLSFFNSLF